MVRVTLTLSDKKTKKFLAEIIPKVLLTKKGNHELVLVIDESETPTKGYLVKETKKQIVKSKDGITLKGDSSEIVLTSRDLNKVKRLMNWKAAD